MCQFADLTMCRFDNVSPSLARACNSCLLSVEPVAPEENCNFHCYRLKLRSKPPPSSHTRSRDFLQRGSSRALKRRNLLVNLKKLIFITHLLSCDYSRFILSKKLNLRFCKKNFEKILCILIIIYKFADKIPREEQ